MDKHDGTTPSCVTATYWTCVPCSTDARSIQRYDAMKDTLVPSSACCTPHCVHIYVTTTRVENYMVADVDEKFLKTVHGEGAMERTDIPPDVYCSEQYWYRDNETGGPWTRANTVYYDSAPRLLSTGNQVQRDWTTDYTPV